MLLINKHPIEIQKFPNGESRIMKDEVIKNSVGFFNEITLKYEDDGDLFRLKIVKDFIDDYNPRNNLTKTSLKILYMPYSRQDRDGGNSVFTLKSVCNFINSLNFDQVVVLEPHSDVTPALLNRCQVVNKTLDILDKAMSAVGFDKENDIIIFPDAGAQKRYSVDSVKHQLTGLKHRDFNTGKIDSMQLVGTFSHKQLSPLSDDPLNIIIVDDLCSYGGTFKMAASCFYELLDPHMGRYEIARRYNMYLVVTHAETSMLKGGIEESGLFKKVFCTSSLLDEESLDKIKNNDFYKIY